MNSLAKEQLSFIFGRRSIRVYQPGVVSQQAVQLMLEAAMAAPSAVAQDPWRFVVIRNPDRLKKIADVLPHGKMLASASVGIVVCGDIQAAHDHQLSYLLQDCSAAIENLLLTAHVIGLGACWLGIHPREQRLTDIRQILMLPTNIIPVAGIAIGHPGETKEARTRFNPASVHYEQW